MAGATRKQRRGLWQEDTNVYDRIRERATMYERIRGYVKRKKKHTPLMHARARGEDYEFQVRR